MEVKVLSESGNTVKLLLKGMDHSFVNALRRQIMSGIPVLAVEDVHIYENNSVMLDEMLAHRLGLIPLKMDSKRYKEGDKVKLVLEKEGPGMVYSRDVKSTDPKIEVAETTIPIAKLSEGQKIKLEMDALVGTGKQHSKWQPAIAAYTEMPLVKGEKHRPSKSEILETVVDDLHRDVLIEKGQKVEYDPATFVFMVESHGNLEPKELFFAAAEGLKGKLEELRKELKNLS